MRLRSMLLSIAGVAVLSTGPLFAQPAPAPSNAPAKKALDPNEIVCEKQDVLGSRLATQKVCHTRAEWAELRRSDRQEIERVQTQRGCNGRC